MGCSVLPTSTWTFAPSTVTTGTCFSTAASVVLAVSSAIGSPQHTSGTPASKGLTATLPQCRHL